MKGEYQLTYSYRGDSEIKDQNKLQEILANLMQLENVGVFLGSGASVAAGGLIMSGVWNDFVTKSRPSAEWLRDEAFVSVDSNSSDKEGTTKKIKPPRSIEQLVSTIAISVEGWSRELTAAYTLKKKIRCTI